MNDYQSRLSNLLESTKILKPVMNLDDLLQHLEDLNLTINNKIELSHILTDKGYFKFSGYRKIFLTSFTEGKWSGKYEDGVTADFLIALMQLDSDLSKLFFEYISIIEMKVKSRAAYFISKNYGSIAYLDKKNFTCDEKWEDFMLNQYFKIMDKGKRNNDPIIIHHISNYDSKLPIWALFNKLSFGAFTFFLQNLNPELKEQLFPDIFFSSKTQFNIQNYGYTKAYTEYLNIIKFLRNRVCHHDRIIDYKHKFIPATNKYKIAFTDVFESNNINYLYLSDIAKLMGCFLDTEDYKTFMGKYCERITLSKSRLPIQYKSRLLNELGYKVL